MDLDAAKEWKWDENSKYGLTGLRNLGNTCFMNSGLSCLSQTPLLTEYFLSDAYKEDINPDNVLASENCEIAKKYAYLLKHLHMGTDNVFAPTKFKKEIGKKNPTFADYNQQDVADFLTATLDGLHEDLNRVVKKPYVESDPFDN